MKVIALFAAFILTAICTSGQNLIGYSCQEIRVYMTKNHTEMSFNNVTNSRFKYLKYSDGTDSETLLFFLDTDSVCKSVRMICDVSLKAGKVKEFNSVYKKIGDNKWMDRRNGKDYLIEIKDENWYSIITIEPDK
jgi:hypothetical protein